MDAYTPEQITRLNVEVINSNNLRITYAPMLETLFFCPGVNMTETEEAVLISFVRCRIKESCRVTHQAEQTASGNYNFILNNNGKPVFQIYDSGKQKIYPKD